MTGLTAQDYKELAFIVSAEAQRDSPDEFAVAASVLNRLATGRFGSSISEIARRPGQYEAVTKGLLSMSLPCSTACFTRGSTNDCCCVA